LREAIIRLREQSSIEKMELSRQLRAAEKDSSLVASLKEEIAKLIANEKTMKEEIKELKDMVDQGSAFEQMVEDLSERVLAVEDNNIALQATIRELEEGAELSAEMEEAQAEEIKMLMIELQNRETVVVNLEEAIKM
jgi:exonuclease VII small subunit